MVSIRPFQRTKRIRRSECHNPARLSSFRPLYPDSRRSTDRALKCDPGAIGRYRATDGCEAAAIVSHLHLLASTEHGDHPQTPVRCLSSESTGEQPAPIGKPAKG